VTQPFESRGWEKKIGESSDGLLFILRHHTVVVALLLLDDRELWTTAVVVVGWGICEPGAWFGVEDWRNWLFLTRRTDLEIGICWIFMGLCFLFLSEHGHAFSLWFLFSLFYFISFMIYFSFLFPFHLCLAPVAWSGLRDWIWLVAV
jgi:hypothetical protein